MSIRDTYIYLDLYNVDIPIPQIIYAVTIEFHQFRHHRAEMLCTDFLDAFSKSLPCSNIRDTVAGVKQATVTGF